MIAMLPYTVVPMYWCVPIGVLALVIGLWLRRRFPDGSK